MTNEMIKGKVENCSFALSNTGHWHLIGNIYGHPTIPDGHLMTSSRVLSFAADEQNKEKCFVVTRNSVYEINLETAQFGPEELITVLMTVEGIDEKEIN